MFTDRAIKSFNELDYFIFDYIIQNTEKVTYMRIRELAAETHVSTATIVRFCKKLGCEGFSEFKIKLKLHLDQQERLRLKSTQNTLTEFVERTLKGVFESYIQETASIVSKCDQVIFLGIGSSGIMAEYGARHFSSLGTFSLHIKDPFFPIRSHNLHRSVTIAMSVSGETAEIINLIKDLKKEGSTIVSITNNKDCTIAKLSDLNISYYVTEEYIESSNITTQIPVVYILESIARELYKIKHNN